MQLQRIPLLIFCIATWCSTSMCMLDLGTKSEKLKLSLAPRIERILNDIDDLPPAGSQDDPRLRAVIEITNVESYQRGEDENIIALDLRNNQLERLPTKFSYPNLVELDCSHNALSKFPVEIVGCDNLARLFLNNNKITAISPLIFYLENITVLCLAHNQLNLLPNEIGDLEQLAHLDVCDNLIDQLPDSFKKLVDLKYLNVSKNKLTAEQIKELQKQLVSTMIED